MDNNVDQKDIRTQVTAAYVLVGLSPLILLFNITGLNILLFMVGIIFSSLLIYRRKNIPDLQRNLTNFSIILFILGLMIFELVLAADISGLAQSLSGHVKNDGVQVKYLASALYGLFLMGMTGTGILFGVCYALLGVGLFRGRGRILFIAAMAVSIILSKIAQILSFDRLIASLGSPDSYLSISSMHSKLAAETSFNVLYTTSSLLLSILGTLIIALSFIVLAAYIYNGRIALIYKEKNGETDLVRSEIE